MRKQDLMVMALVAIILIGGILIIGSAVKKKKNNETVEEGNQKTVEQAKKEYEEAKGEIDIKGTENVEVKIDGTTENTSGAVKQAKTVAGLRIENITIQYIGGQTEIRGDIKNNTGAEIDADFVMINIKDSNGKTFRTIESYIGKVKPGVDKLLNVTTQADISNMKDIEFVKK